MSRLERALHPVSSAVTGVVLAHAATYVLAFPDADRRGQALVTTGHAYWHHAMALALATGTAVIGVAVWRGVRRATGRPVPLPHSFLGRLASQASWQLALFAGVEIAERAMSGVGPDALIGDPAFMFGVVLQVAIAAVFVLVLQGVEQLVEGIVRRLQAPPGRRRIRPPLPGAVRDVRVSPPLCPVSSRAPPALSPSS